jgi:hypothetical protein
MTEAQMTKTAGRPICVLDSPCLDFGFVSSFEFRISSFLLLVLLTAPGCATHVIVPQHVRDPQTIYLTDYGRHSSLLLPAKNGGWDEYAYGDWNYWALIRQPGWFHAMRATICSPQATLGFRHIPKTASDAELKKVLNCVRLMRLDISRERAEMLSENLAARYWRDAGSEQPIFSRYSDLYHVKDPEQYWGLHNCNHETADWLEQLGCEVRGPSILSNFVVVGTPND